MTRIEQGLELVRRACDDPEAVPAAQQLLRNWHHRLGRVTVLNHVALGQLLDRIEALTELLGELHADPPLVVRRRNDAIDRIESIRRRLIELVGATGLD